MSGNNASMAIKVFEEGLNEAIRVAAEPAIERAVDDFEKRLRDHMESVVAKVAAEYMVHKMADRITVTFDLDDLKKIAREI